MCITCRVSKHIRESKRGQAAYSSVTGQKHPITLVHKTKDPFVTFSSEEKPVQVVAVSELLVSYMQQLALC